jgi:hypothetical protein
VDNAELVVLTVVTKNIAVLWYVTPCSPVEIINISEEQHFAIFRAEK